MASGDHPLVSIVIPVWNYEKYIAECIESVLAQDYNHIEVLVADDGSTDGTGDIVDRYREVTHLRLPHRGAAPAVNYGISQSLGELVTWLSADDLYMPEKISIQVAVMLDTELKPDATYTDFEIIDSSGNTKNTIKCDPPSDDRMMYQVMTHNIINGSSIMLRREVFERVGYFDETLEYDADGEMWIRMLANGLRILHIPAVLLKYRVHSQSQSNKRETHRQWKDTVRTRAIKRYSAGQIFPFLSSSQYPEAYKKLAYQLYTNGLTEAAKAAIGKTNDRA